MAPFSDSVCKHFQAKSLRAAMEAIAYRFALVAAALEPFAPGATLVASGNALRSSATWVQILADVSRLGACWCQNAQKRRYVARPCLLWKRRAKYRR